MGSLWGGVFVGRFIVTLRCGGNGVFVGRFIMALCGGGDVFVRRVCDIEVWCVCVCFVPGRIHCDVEVWIGAKCLEEVFCDIGVWWV